MIMAKNGGGNGAFKLDRYKTVDEAKMVVLDPGSREPLRDDEDRTLILTLAADLHNATLAAKRLVTKEVQKATVLTGELEPEDERDINLRFMAARILDWGPMPLELDGRPLSPNSLQDKVALLANLDWLRQELELFFVRRNAFLASKQTASLLSSSTAFGLGEPHPPEAGPSPTTGAPQPGRARQASARG